MIILPDLPYAYTALEPVLSETTLRTHHGRHHARYVEVTNRHLMDGPDAGASLEDVVTKAWGRSARGLFNNAAQALNHGLYWASMTAEPSSPDAGLIAAINTAYDGFDDLREKFIAEGVGHFGSGWVWLTSDHGRLSVLATHDGDTVARMATQTPLLVCDVWEHAYYLDHRSERGSYLAGWWDRLANWAFASRQYEASLGRARAWTYPQRKSAAAEAQTSASTATAPRA